MFIGFECARVGWPSEEEIVPGFRDSQARPGLEHDRHCKLAGVGAPVVRAGRIGGIIRGDGDELIRADVQRADVEFKLARCGIKVLRAVVGERTEINASL